MRILALPSKVFVVVVALLLASGTQAQEPSARQVVETFQEQLLAAMKEARALGLRGRYLRLLSPIEEAFAVAAMVRIATAPHFDGASPAQRERLVVAFRRMAVSTLATFFDDYGGQVFRVVGEGPRDKNVYLVDTKIVSPDGSSHDISYVMRTFDGRWRIIDVIVDKGISELSVRRSEYRRVLGTEGVDGLIRSLNDKADQLISD